MSRNIFLFAVLIIMGIALSACQPAASGTVTVNDAWARPAPAGQSSAVYFVISSGLAEDDILRSAVCDKAMVTEVHMSSMDASGKMTMAHQESVAIPAGEQVAFKPGGLHVMLMNLKEDLVVDQKLTVTLNFEKAGDIVVEAAVREP